MHKELMPESPNRLKKIFGEKFYHFSLAILLVSLPLSPFLVSISQQLLTINWLLEGNFKNKFKKLKACKSLWFLLLIPLVHITWLINTSDFYYALHDLKIKIPLLILPLVIGTSPMISAKKLKQLLYLFVGATLTATFVSLIVYLGYTSVEITTSRDISIIISHIRFGLMVVFSIFILIFYLKKNYRQNSICFNITQVFSIFWMFIFLIILQSLTSWVIITITTPLLLYIYHKKLKNKKIRILAISITLLINFSIAMLIFNVSKERNKHPKQEITQLPKYTKHGNKYLNDTTNQYSENGNLVYILISKKEMQEAWNMRSKIPFNGNDIKGYRIYTTALRYLTSKNYTKDLDGIMALDDQDIRLIEQGTTSYVYRNHTIPFIKIYEVFEEMSDYLQSGNSNSKSIALRFEFTKTSLYIIKNNFLFGVGTGDVKAAFKKAYIEIDSLLNKKFQLRAHNQYLTFFIAFGIIGFVLCIIGLFLPVFFLKRKKGFLLIAFLLIVFLSMINEDLLETQAGVTFFITFYTILIFSKQEELNN